MSLTALLLADPSPCLRWLTLRRLLHRPESDDEVRELAAMRLQDPIVSELTRTQLPDGSWEGDLLRTSLALSRLGYLGFGAGDDAVRRGAEYLFSCQQADGSWPLGNVIDGEVTKSTYSMIPLQTSLPLRGVAAGGYASDPRAERAYDWLMAQRLLDGAWPTGLSSGVYGYVAGYRKMPHSRWGCRSNTTSVLTCLALHPQRRKSPEAQRALDLLLGRETRERQVLGYEIARTVGAEPIRGFITFYGRFDLAHILRLCAQMESDIQDERIQSLVTTLQEWQGPYGLWEYQPRPQLSRWLTFELLDALMLLERNSGETSQWISQEPRTPFQTYPKKKKRF